MDSAPPDLAAVRQRLIRLHKTLIESERVTYERVQGRVATPGELLQLVIHDSWFVWLHPLSELIVRLDELLAGWSRRGWWEDGSEWFTGHFTDRAPRSIDSIEQVAA